MAESHEEITILVEFPEESDPKGGLSSPEHVEKSKAALESALESIQELAMRTVAGIKTLSEPPDSLKISFGFKLDAEDGAMIAQESSKSAIQVSLSWEGKASSEKTSRVGFLSQ